jgi:hypothetical protein
VIGPRMGCWEITLAFLTYCYFVFKEETGVFMLSAWLSRFMVPDNYDLPYIIDHVTKTISQQPSQFEFKLGLIRRGWIFVHNSSRV